MCGSTGGQEASKIILVVEDDEQHALVLAQIISQLRPHRVFHASDGPTTLKFTEHLKPDLFILDYWLPTMNGIELYERLRLRKELQDIPVIIISGFLPLDEIHARGIESLPKPFDLNELLLKIDTLLGEQPESSPHA
ncbi:response regulator [Ktedonobacter robiniae]|uniref:Response regulator n=1 Tax=Ktedonobacter robiniae TaxID=2778365 RepID=A0ABQ3UIB1_9CHLR|nr:response regulator [Ktedonobacter robiniae]GHO52413.1 response regulator [Ktedonobacter robiniae]